MKTVKQVRIPVFVQINLKLYVCYTDIDDCSPNQCLHGATCADLIDGFNCECKPGYRGNICEIDIFECESNPCMNNAKCLDGINEFTCACPRGFNGTVCERSIR